MKQKNIVARIALLAAIAAPAVAQNRLSSGDEHILSELAQANLNEISAGQIAQQKAQQAEVKSFAQRMVDDHSKGLQQVQELARSKNVTVPTAPDAQHRALADKLNSLTGAAFDRAYLERAGVADHQAAHQQLMQAEQRAQDPDVKALVGTLRPVVDQHLGTVQALARKQGVTAY